jgi:hypothetical protein
MPNFKIYIRNPYPFRWDDYQAVQDALKCTYGGSPVYFKEWPIDYVSLDNVTKTTANEVAKALKFLHRQSIGKDKRYGLTTHTEEVEVEIRGMLDGRPEWARDKR